MVPRALRLLDPLLELALERPGVLPHPPAVPCEEGDRREDHDGGDEIGTEVEEGAGQETHADAGANARQETKGAPECHVAVIAASANLVEVRVDNAEEKGGLKRLAEGDDEGAAHRYSATMRPFAVFS